MAGIQSFREQYPQYAEIDDATIAEAVYKKDYSSRDYDEFMSRFLGTPEEMPEEGTTMPEEALPETPVAEEMADTPEIPEESPFTEEPAPETPTDLSDFGISAEQQQMPVEPTAPPVETTAEPVETTAEPEAPVEEPATDLSDFGVTDEQLNAPAREPFEAPPEEEAGPPSPEELAALSYVRNTMDDGYEPGWWSGTARATLGTAAGAGAGFYKLAADAMDNVNTLYKKALSEDNDVLTGARDWLNDEGSKAQIQSIYNKMIADYSTPENAFLKLASHGVRAIPDMAAVIATTALTRNPNAGYAVMGAQVFSNEYGRLRYQDEQSIEQAFYGASAATAYELGGEKAFSVLEPIAQGLRGGKQLLMTSFNEGLSEMATEGLTIADELTRGGKPFEGIGRTLLRVGEAGVIGTVPGAGMHMGGNVIQRINNKMNGMGFNTDQGINDEDFEKYVEAQKQWLKDNPQADVLKLSWEQTTEGPEKDKLDLDLGTPTEELPVLDIEEQDPRTVIRNAPHETLMENPMYKRFYNASDLGELSKPHEERMAEAKEAYIRKAEKLKKWKPIVEEATGKPADFEIELTGEEAATSERQTFEDNIETDEDAPEGFDPSETVYTNIDGEETEYSAEEAARIIKLWDKKDDPDDPDDGPAPASSGEKIKDERWISVTEMDGSVTKHLVTREERDQMAEQLDEYRQKHDEEESLDSPRSEAREEREIVIPSDEVWGSTVEEIDPETLTLNPKLMQYKSATDSETGRNKQLEGVTVFDASKAGIIVAWEDVNGKRVVADGHQRVNLLKDLQAQGKEPGTKILTRVYREDQGFSAKDVRAIAAEINIAQGTGTAMDAAKVIRGMSEQEQVELMKRMPVNSALVRDAIGLSKLGDEAFQVVVNELIEPRFGSMVGNAFEEAEQTAAMQIMIKSKPANFSEAYAMIADIQAGGFVKSEQGGLFGEVEMESLIKERAQILSAAESKLRKNVTVFNALTKEEKRIEGAGNVLDTEANKKIAQEAGSIIDRALRTINTNPELNNELNKIAKDFRDGNITKAQAANLFVEAATAYSDGSSGESADRPSDEGTGQDVEVTEPKAETPEEVSDVKDEDKPDDLLGGIVEEYEDDPDDPDDGPAPAAAGVKVNRPLTEEDQAHQDKVDYTEKLALGEIGQLDETDIDYEKDRREYQEAVDKVRQEWEDGKEGHIKLEKAMLKNPAPESTPKAFLFKSRHEALTWAAAYGYDNAAVMEAHEVDGKFQIRAKTNAKNKRWLVAKPKDKYITLAERDRIWQGWRDEALTVHGRGRTIFSLFDRTGNWSRPYAEAGYNVVQVDIDHPLWAIDIMSLDAETLMEYGWDDVHGVIAAPPCNHFSNACRWSWPIKDGDGRTQQGLDLLEQAHDIVAWLKPDFFVYENPASSRIDKPEDFDSALDTEVVKYMGEPVLNFNPNQYGDDYTKKTKLWGRFNEELPEANVFPAQGSRIWNLTGYTKKQKQERSVTPVGFADAWFMANSPISEKSVDSMHWMQEGGGIIDYAIDWFSDWNSSVMWFRKQAAKGRTPEYFAELDIEMPWNEQGGVDNRTDFEVWIEAEIKKAEMVKGGVEQAESLAEAEPEPTAEPTAEPEVEEAATEEQEAEEYDPTIEADEWYGNGPAMRRDNVEFEVDGETYSADLSIQEFNGEDQLTIDIGQTDTFAGGVIRLPNVSREDIINENQFDDETIPDAIAEAFTNKYGEETELPKGETRYFKGNEAVTTGKRVEKHGGVFEEVLVLEGGETGIRKLIKLRDNFEMTPEETPLEQRQREKRERDANREEVPVEAGTGDLFAGQQTPDLFPDTTLTGEQQTPEQELAELKTEYDRVSAERMLPFPEQRKIAEENGYGDSFRTWRDMSLEDQKRRLRRIKALQTTIEGGTERLSLDETPKPTEDATPKPIEYSEELKYLLWLETESTVGLGKFLKTSQVEKHDPKGMSREGRLNILMEQKGHNLGAARTEQENLILKGQRERAAAAEPTKQLQDLAQTILDKTNGTADVRNLMGPANVDTRQYLMRLLTGKKTPKAKAGITILQQTVAKEFGVAKRQKGTSIAQFEDELHKKIMDTAKYGEDSTENDTTLPGEFAPTAPIPEQKTDEITEEISEDLQAEPESAEFTHPETGLTIGDEISVMGDRGYVIGINGDTIQFKSHRNKNPNAYNNVPIELVKYISTPPNSPASFSKAVRKAGEKVKGKVDWNTARMTKILGEQMYSYDLYNVVVKELVQNSFDGGKAAVKDGLAKSIDIKVTTNSRDRSITIEDNGIGMTEEILKKAFFTVGGTTKRNLTPEESSGGFGVAKVGFMLNAQKIVIRTKTKGSKVAIIASVTQDEIAANSFDYEFEDADPDEHGTTVTVYIPETKEDENGEMKYYGFPYSIDQIKFLEQPLVADNVTVTYENANDPDAKQVMPIGKNLDLTEMPLLTTATFPDWGTADIYYGEKRVKHGRAKVLSAGVYQFSWSPQLRKGEGIPFDIIINVKPKVKAEHRFYPFTQERERWMPRIKEDIILLERYLAKVALGEEAKSLQENMGGIVSMPVLSPKDAKKALAKRKAQKAFKAKEAEKMTPEQEAELEVLRKQVAERREAEREITITQDKGVTDKAGEEVIPDKATELEREAKKQEEEKEKLQKEGKMTTDKDAPDRSEFMDVMIQDPKLPLFHNNTDVNVLEIGREHGNPEQFFAELGTLFMEMKDTIAESGMWDYKGMGAEDLFFTGISIDKGYGGVHIKLPYKAVFVNPLYNEWGEETLYGTRGVIINTMMHEIAHKANMGHNEGHNAAQVRVERYLEDSGMMDYFRDSILTTLGRHEAVFKAMREAYDKSSARNVGKSFKDIEGNSEARADTGTEVNPTVAEKPVSTGKQSKDGGPVYRPAASRSGVEYARGVFAEGRTEVTDEQVEQIVEVIKPKGPFAKNRDDWQTPGKSGPKTKKRAKDMRKPPFSVARTSTRGISIAEAKDAVSQALGQKLTDRIEFYETLEDIPESAIRSGRQLITAAGMVEGFVVGKKAYLITKNLADTERAVWVAWHEMWHRGAKVRYGVQFNRALRKARTNNVVRRLSDAIASQREDKLSVMEATEEALAELNAAMRSGNYEQIKSQYGITVPESMKSGWRAMVQGWLDAIRNIMRRTGAYLADTQVGADAGMTDMQISNMVRGVKLDVAANVTSPAYSIVHPDAKMPREESENRWVAAGKGYTRGTLKEWVSDHVTAVNDGFSRHFIFLPNDSQFAEVAEQLRKVEAAPEASRDAVIRMMKLVTGNMTAADLDLFTRKVVLDDLTHEITLEHDLPMDLTPDEVHETLERIDTILESRPDIQEAIETRRILVQSIARKLVDAGVLTENEILNPYYYRHQVLDYMGANKRFGSGGSSSIKTPKRAGRKGSLKDINVNYLEVEFEWLNKALIDIEVAETLSWIKESDHNARAEAVAAGRESNERLFNAMLADDLAVNGYDVMSKDGKRVLRRSSPLNEEYKKFSRRIAMGMGEIKKGLDERSFDIPEQYTDIAENIMEELGGRHPQFYEFLGWLADNGMEGSNGAKMVFSAINQRKAWKRSLLGEDYVNTQSMDELVEKGFAPEGYVTWQPDKGRLLYTASTLPEHVVNAMVNKMAEDPNGLSAEDAAMMATNIRNLLAVGGPKYQMIIPAELAETLDSLHDEHMSGMIGNAMQAGLTQWKRWQLVSPWRFLKYNINNFSGDIDAVIAIGPKILKKFPMAVAELTNVMFRGATPSARYNEAVRRGVFASGLSMQEIKQIDEMAEFRNIMHREKISMSMAGGRELVKRLANIPLAIFRTMQKVTWWRENMMRYAAYLHYSELLQDGYQLGPQEYGASRPEIMEELTDYKDKAAMIARKTVGDYGDISHFGQTMRAKAYPFWSWVEVNTKRYWRLGANAENTLVSGLKSGSMVGAAMGVKAATWIGMRTLATYTTVYLWNNLLFGDEEKELTTSQRARLHINLGRTSDNKIRTIRFQGALSDFLDWVGFGDVTDTIIEVEAGRATWSEVMEAAAVAPVNKFVGGLTPVVKVPVELIRGESWWPDVFHPRRIRDRWRYAAQLWAVENEYDAFMGKASPGYLSKLKTIAWNETDVGQASYNEIRTAGYKYLERTTDVSGSSSRSTPRSNALYELKLAQRFKDTRAEEIAYEKVMSLSKNVADGRRAIRGYAAASEPLAMLNKKQRREFLRTLTAREEERLEQADEWHSDTFK